MGIDERTLQKLDDWQQEEGCLPENVELYRDLLRISVEAKKSIPSPQPILTELEAGATLRNGIPLVKWDAISVDWPTFRELFQRAFALLAEHAVPSPEKSERAAFDITLLQEMAKAWYEDASLSSWAVTLGVMEDALARAIQCALRPFLKTRTEVLAGLVDQGQWRRGYCPVCGGKPDFAFLDKDRGARRLVCSRCDTDWLFQRLECPYCRNSDQKELAYFTDEKELYRLYTCERCHRYLKAIDLRQTESEILAPLERLLTADMDRQGQEKGYK
ncbi:MAG: formate dehydrogenase accessory protein FdhE [Dehalococcoidia bacterium]|nr:formate dehydrogenase accessory protein FdhE [Dehalococcoidia bacterium]